MPYEEIPKTSDTDSVPPYEELDLDPRPPQNPISGVRTRNLTDANPTSGTNQSKSSSTPPSPKTTPSQTKNNHPKTTSTTTPTSLSSSSSQRPVEDAAP